VVPLSLIGGLQVVNSQFAIVALGLFSTDANVGVFRVLAQCELLVAFSVTAINIAIAPYIVKLHVAGEKHALQKMATWSARVTTAMALCIGLTFISFGPKILDIAFGAEFEVGSRALTVLCVGQIVSALAGTSMIFLNMTGNELGTTKSVATATLLNVVLNVLLVPDFALVGAAIASASSAIVLNASLAMQVWTRLGLRSVVR
jgi:O-antigen/teichoic acid export membrane protein